MDDPSRTSCLLAKLNNFEVLINEPLSLVAVNGQGRNFEKNFKTDKY